MNNYQIGQYSQQFKDSAITINPYILKKIGIIKNKSILRVDDYQLSCVPYSISLSSCRLLLILSPREQTIITGNKSGQIMLHLEFLHPNLDKEIPLFFRINIKNFQQLNSRLNQCLLDAELSTVPQDYREILIEYFLKDEKGRELFNSPEKNSISFKAVDLIKNKCSKTGNLRISNNKIDFRIIEMSSRKLVIYIDTDKNILEKADGKLICELFIDGALIFINAAMNDYTASSEVEGYFIVSLELEYSLCLVDAIDRIMQTKSKAPAEETLDTEEIQEEDSQKNEPVENTDGENSDAEDVLIEETPENKE